LSNLTSPFKIRSHIFFLIACSTSEERYDFSSPARNTASFKEGGDRVCVQLEGKMLEMTSVIVRKEDEDIIDQLPKQTRENYFLVESAEIVDTQETLEDS
jgi:hypothetical protein